MMCTNIFTVLTNVIRQNLNVLPSCNKKGKIEKRRERKKFSSSASFFFFSEKSLCGQV